MLYCELGIDEQILFDKRNCIFVLHMNAVYCYIFIGNHCIFALLKVSSHFHTANTLYFIVMMYIYATAFIVHSIVRIHI